jgi:hypothetical protein
MSIFHEAFELIRTKRGREITSKDKHRRHDEVGDETEEQENNVRGGSPASEHDLKHSVDGRTLPLDLNGKDREEQNLDGRSGSVPVTHGSIR